MHKMPLADQEMGAAPVRAATRRWMRAVGMLAACCLLWGWSFPVAQLAIGPFERMLQRAVPMAHGDFPLSARVGLSAVFNGWRFAITTVLYAAITWRRQRGFTRDELAGGVLVGLFFTAGMVVQNVGLRYTLPSVSGFLTALLVVFAPLAQALWLRRRVGAKTWMAVVLALAGTFALSQPAGAPAQNTVVLANPWPWFGEGLTVLGALFFTGQVLALDHYGGRVDTTRLTLVMFAATAVGNALVGVGLGAGSLYGIGAVEALGSDPTVWWTMGSLVIFSSIVALHLMNVYQPRVTPATASVVYCLEPVFAAAFSVLFRTERLTGTVLLGGAIILAAVLLAARGGRPH